ncbi:MAG TPA: sterol desaturase family protein [Flavitalea sp.]|nr:sterol desaturase family protein [Flavitalea sp.]
MNLNPVYIFFIIYITAIVIEAAYDHYHQKGLYDARDTMVNLLLGAMGVLLRIVTKGTWIALWIYLYRFAPFQLPETIWSWVLLFFCNEFIYYWFHRFSHQNRWLWAVHVNHHSSEKMNFSNAARVPFLNVALHNLFWIPLLFIGFNPMMIFTMETIGFLFAFFQHTQLIGRLPVFELIFNAPSHHRVHHASNPEYINKNYGNVLIIFDRLFGTFKEEDRKINTRFGLQKSLDSYNFFTVIFHEWVAMYKNRKAANSNS